MATNGFFTYHDLYGGHAGDYYHRSTSQYLSSTTTEVPSTLNTTIPSLSTTTNIIDLIASTTTTTATTPPASNNESFKFVRLIPFAYFHWFLIGLAFLLTSLLTLIFIYYCRSHCRKRSKSYKEKKQPFPSFYPYRKPKGHIYDPTSPYPFPSPTRPCPTKSIERRNHQLLREGLNAVGSPRMSRTDVSQLESSSSFSSTASDLLAEIKGRLNIRSSKSSVKNEPSYETQRANMALKDEAQNTSLLIDIN